MSELLPIPIACDDDGRRRATADPASGHNGIDYIEVDPADQRRLTVGFLKDLSGPALGPANVRIEGGERITDIEVIQVTPGTDTALVAVDQPGDFSPYVLRLVTSKVNALPPAGYDPALSAATFSFKAACPSDLDCARTVGLDVVAPPEPVLNYLAKDYEGFRGLILDRMALLLPGWRERNPADGLVTVAEVLADAADRLSYRQDAIATEFHLGSARTRVAVRRHTRLLDYRLHDGCTARTWVRFEVEAGSPAELAVLPAGSPVLGGQGPSASFAPADLDELAPLGATVYSTLTPVTLRAARNRITIHTWSGRQCRLPAGATAATLRNDPDLELAPGDLLLFEEVVDPTTGQVADADPRHRQVVRLTSVTPTEDPVELTPGNDPTPLVEVRWAGADALTFPLVVTTLVADGGTDDPVECGLARGNLGLAHHARRRPRTGWAHGAGGTVGARPPWRPVLTTAPLASAVPLDLAAPAGRALVQDPRVALPLVDLSDGADTWGPRVDLLGSDRFDRGFVVELERDGRAGLRFGDDVHGRRPAAGTVFDAAWWEGGGRAGNIGRDVLARVGTTNAGIRKVTNPLPGAGGQDPEPIDEARQHAPAAFFTQERAVTTEDWATVARRSPDVQDAVARVRWTGSWWTVFLTLDLVGGLRLAEDPALEARVTQALDRYRIAGYDLELTDPIDVPIDLTVWVCVRTEAFRADVHAGLLDAFAARDVPGVGRGCFHPDNFSFGRPLWVSDVVARAMAVPGVVDAAVTVLHRWAEAPADELTKGRLAPGDLEVIRLDNDPSEPEHGVLRFDLEGGR
jgi:hypothetical protein